jgi:hypothetical protein
LIGSDGIDGPGTSTDNQIGKLEAFILLYKNKKEQ